MHITKLKFGPYLTNRTHSAVLILAGLFSLASSALCDDRMDPELASYNSRGFFWVAEVFPPKSRQNQSKKPLCYLYQMGYSGTQWEIRPRLEWSAPLVNEEMPMSALVSPEGQIVTLDEYTRPGYQNAVVIYDRQGKPTKSFHLDELIPPEERHHIVPSSGFRLWREGARYFFLTKPARFYIVLPWDKVMEFSLADGKFKTGHVMDFLPVASLASSSSDTANEESLIWSTNLRFSSITDILNPKIPPVQESGK
jgi:hypothetical protein